MDGARTAGSMLRWVRASALALVALCTSVVAHVSAGGLLPGPAALLLLLVVVTMAAAPLLRVEASSVRVVVLLLASQTLMHGVLAVLAGHWQSLPSGLLSGTMGSAGAPVPGKLAGSGHGSGHLEPSVWAQQLLADLSNLKPAMVVAHAVATVVVGLWLAAGERAVWAFLALRSQPLFRAWRTLLRATVWCAGIQSRRQHRLRSQRGEDGPPRLQAWRMCRAATRRGPPLLCTI